MPKFETFEGWLKEKWGSQSALAEKLSVNQNTISSWKTGRSRIHPDYQKELRKLGYDGPFPEPGGEVTLADLESIRQEIRVQAAWVREEIRKENTVLAADLAEALKKLAEIQGILAGKH